MREKERSKRIVDELLTYFYDHKINNIQLNLDFAEDGLHIEMQGRTPQPPDNLELFAASLNAPRDPNIEQYYDELLGNSHHEKEDYHLLGVMVDDAKIMYDPPFFDIKLFRKR